MVIDLPVENNRAKYRRNMVVMGPCFKCQEIPAFLIISGGLEGSASASHLYLRHAGRAICWWPLTSSSSACRSARCSRQQQLLPLLLLLPASGRRHCSARRPPAGAVGRWCRVGPALRPVSRRSTGSLSLSSHFNCSNCCSWYYSDTSLPCLKMKKNIVLDFYFYFLKLTAFTKSIWNYILKT